MLEILSYPLWWHSAEIFSSKLINRIRPSEMAKENLICRSWAEGWLLITVPDSVPYVSLCESQPRTDIILDKLAFYFEDCRVSIHEWLALSHFTRSLWPNESCGIQITRVGLIIRTGWTVVCSILTEICIVAPFKMFCTYNQVSLGSWIWQTVDFAPKIWVKSWEARTPKLGSFETIIRQLFAGRCATEWFWDCRFYPKLLGCSKIIKYITNMNLKNF